MKSFCSARYAIRIEVRSKVFLNDELPLFSDVGLTIYGITFALTWKTQKRFRNSHKFHTAFESRSEALWNFVGIAWSKELALHFWKIPLASFYRLFCCASIQRWILTTFERTITLWSTVSLPSLSLSTCLVYVHVWLNETIL